MAYGIWDRCIAITTTCQTASALALCLARANIRTLYAPAPRPSCSMAAPRLLYAYPKRRARDDGGRRREQKKNRAYAYAGVARRQPARTSLCRDGGDATWWRDDYHQTVAVGTQRRWGGGDRRLNVKGMAGRDGTRLRTWYGLHKTGEEAGGMAQAETSRLAGIVCHALLTSSASQLHLSLPAAPSCVSLPLLLPAAHEGERHSPHTPSFARPASMPFLHCVAFSFQAPLFKLSSIPLHPSLLSISLHLCLSWLVAAL